MNDIRVESLFDIIVVGSGPAGLCAAIYGARANKRVLVLAGSAPGGQLTKTTEVENYPGFAEPIMGPDLMDAMLKQVENLGVQIMQTELTTFEKNDALFKVHTFSDVLYARSLIIATGANAKMLGNEGHLLGYGISTCATCDGNFFRNKPVAVVGGGNSALEEALYLSNIASKVYLIHRRTAFRGEMILQQRVQANEKIEILWPYEVASFVGEKKLEAVMIKNTEDASMRTIEVPGAFIAIGHSPNTSFLNGLLDLDDDGYIKEGPKTKIPGLFVAGDVFDKKYRQAITAAGYGCMAAIETLKYLD